MKKMYLLPHCTTCQAILEKTGITEPAFELQDIKTQKITPPQIEAMKDRAGSYEALFSRRALKYKSLNLKSKLLTEEDYKRYILEEYTFLKRPVTIINEKIFIGSQPSVVAALQEALQQS